MKKLIYLACTAGLMALLTNCSQEKDMYNQEAVDHQNKEKITANMKQVFGTDFDPSQDWVMVKNGQVTVIVGDNDFDTKEVQILTAFPSKFSDAHILNNTTAAKGQTITLSFDTPNNIDTLYAALVNSAKQYRAQPFLVGDKEVTFEAFNKTASSRRAQRAAETPSLGEGVASDNVRRKNIDYSNWKNSGWNDQLYHNTQLKKTPIDNFTGYEFQLMKDIISAYVPEKKNNAGRISATDVYVNTENYFTSTGTQQEIVVTPVACGGWFCGWEQLYYYYFDPAKVQGMNDDTRRAYLQQLPKFKLCEVAETFADQSKATLQEKIADSQSRLDGMMNRVDKHYSYTLAYFGDEDNLTQATYSFPEGYRIGFMLRIDSLTIPQNRMKNPYASDDKVGCLNLYADRLLNQEVNQYQNWRKYMNKDMSRAGLFGANGQNYISFEDYEDADFNDIVFQVTGGVELIDDNIILDRNVYTLAFEDRTIGDYDMNDVVIKAQRTDLTHVKYTLVASGAEDALYLRNINGSKLNTTTEVHAIFGHPERKYINTEKGGLTLPVVEEIVEVPATFSFTNNADLPYIYNASEGYEVKVSRKGEDPHGIIIPCDFNYPIERNCVGGTKEPAYTNFNSWGQKKVESTEWYKTPVSGRVYKDI